MYYIKACTWRLNEKFLQHFSFLCKSFSFNINIHRWRSYMNDSLMIYGSVIHNQCTSYYTYTYRVYRGFRLYLKQVRWLFSVTFGHIWSEWYFLRQLEQEQKLPQVWNQTITFKKVCLNLCYTLLQGTIKLRTDAHTF